MVTPESQERGRTLPISHAESERAGLLRTKLYMPAPRPNAVPRADLQARLNARPDARLLLLSAPAGFGKTSLIAGWVATLRAQRDGPRPAWLSLDDADNDLARFWRYLVSALQQAEPGLGGRVQGILAQRSLPPAESWLAYLLNDLAALERPVVLVLDDYHVITSETIHQSLNYLLQHLPPTARLVLLTRADPPLPLARLRVQDELVELRAADLRFTRREIAQFLNEGMSLGLAAGDLALLDQRTEGWPAGIQLAARSLLGYQPAERPAFIRSFSGSHHYVLNYLLEEVLQQQTADRRDFLLRTSVLARLSGPLCAAITGQADSGATLAQLAHDNLFVLPLDDNGHWYRYHALFAESLETRLRDGSPDLWNELHRRASHWCAHNGYVERAISHALACQDYGGAADLIEAVGEKTWASGELATLVRWLDAMPREVIASRMSLRLLYTWVLFLHDRWEDATRLWAETGRVLDASEEPDARDGRGVWLAIGAAMAGHRLEPDETIRMSQDALTRLSAENRTWRAVASIDLGLAYQAQGNSTLAASAFRQAADLSIALKNVYLSFAALGHLSDVCMVLGRLHEAQAVGERLKQLNDMPGGPAIAVDACGDLSLGLVACERNDLVTASRLLEDGLERLWPGGQPRVVLPGRVGLSRVYAARGEWERAREQLELSADMVRELGMPAEGGLVRAHQARLALHEGRLDDARRWLEESGLSTDDAADFRLELSHCVLAEILLATGRHAAAEGLIVRLRAAAERSGRVGSDIQLLLLQALALAGQSRVAEAETALRRAITLGQPQGYIRPFLELGPALIDLLRRPAVARQAPPYVSQILRAAEAEAGTHRGPALTVAHVESAAGLLEPLTPREQEILELIAQGASNQEIADQLVLSVGTVKGHVNHIFGKLDVHNRTAAVARGRDLGLIPL